MAARSGWRRACPGRDPRSGGSPPGRRTGAPAGRGNRGASRAPRPDGRPDAHSGCSPGRTGPSARASPAPPSVVHVPDDGLAEALRAHQCGAWNKLIEFLLHVLLAVGMAAGGALRFANRLAQPREIEGQLLGGDGIGHALDDEVGGLGPAEVAEHHFGGQDERTRVHAVLAGEAGRRAVSGLEHADAVADVASRGDADAAHLGSQGVGDVVAVQVQRGDNVVLLRPQQDLLQEVVGDHVLDDDLAAGARVREGVPGPAVFRLRAEFLAGHFITPLAEGALGELHDVALVHQGHRTEVVVDAVVDGLAHEAFRALPGDRLDADAGTRRETDLGGAQFLLQELDQLLHFLGACRVLDARVDIFRVLAEDHHVHQVGLLHRRADAGEVADGPHAGVEVQALADGDVQRADAAADRRGQGTLDGDHVFLQRVQRLLGQEVGAVVDLAGLLACIDFHPGDAALAAVRAAHRGVDHVLHDRRHVPADAVALDERDDGLVRPVPPEVPVHADDVAALRDLDLLVLHRVFLWTRKENGAPGGAVPSILQRWLSWPR